MDNMPIVTCSQCHNCPMPSKWGAPQFDPYSAIEGDPNSPVWIVALNPKTTQAQHTSEQPNPITWKKTNPLVPHFRRLKGVLGPYWHAKLFKKNGIAHTDIVKCGSPAFGHDEKNAVNYCKGYFLSQVKQYKPKLLLVLSSDAARLISTEAKFPKESTGGQWKFGSKDESCQVILSGYNAPKQERYGRLRLKRDFLAACSQLT